MAIDERERGTADTQELPVVSDDLQRGRELFAHIARRICRIDGGFGLQYFGQTFGSRRISRLPDAALKEVQAAWANISPTFETMGEDLKVVCGAEGNLIPVPNEDPIVSDLAYKLLDFPPARNGGSPVPSSDSGREEYARKLSVSFDYSTVESELATFSLAYGVVHPEHNPTGKANATLEVSYRERTNTQKRHNILAMYGLEPAQGIALLETMAAVGGIAMPASEVQTA